MSDAYKLSASFVPAHPGKLSFEGCAAAQYFTRECEESLTAHLKHLFQYDGEDAGFVVVALPGRPWDDSIFARDMGCFLRELVGWGYIEHARMLAGILLEIVGTDENGFHTYPGHSVRGEKLPGSEIDGICAVAIGMLMLMRRLDQDDPLRAELDTFLSDVYEPTDKENRYHLIAASSRRCPG